MPFCASIRQFFDCTKGNKKDDGTMWLVVKQENAAEPEIVKNLDEKLINASVTTVERLECPIPTTFVVYCLNGNLSYQLLFKSTAYAECEQFLKDYDKTLTLVLEKESVVKTVITDYVVPLGKKVEQLNKTLGKVEKEVKSLKDKIQVQRTPNATGDNNGLLDEEEEEENGVKVEQDSGVIEKDLPSFYSAAPDEWDGQPFKQGHNTTVFLITSIEDGSHLAMFTNYVKSDKNVAEAINKLFKDYSIHRKDYIQVSQTAKSVGKSVVLVDGNDKFDAEHQYGAIFVPKDWNVHLTRTKIKISDVNHKPRPQHMMHDKSDIVGRSIERLIELMIQARKTL